MTWSTSSKTTWPESWCSTTKYECSLRFWTHGLLKTIWPGSLGSRAPRWPGHPGQDLRNQGCSLPAKPDEDAEQGQTTILNWSDWFNWIDEQLLFETKVVIDHFVRSRKEEADGWEWPRSAPKRSQHLHTEEVGLLVGSDPIWREDQSEMWSSTISVSVQRSSSHRNCFNFQL